MAEDELKTRNLKAVAEVFLKLGLIGFGGPAAHIAMMREEVVLKRQWLSDRHFLDLVGATNLIPGPNSTEMAIHIGYEKAGWKGLLTAGLCFILPAVFITGILAWLYKRYGQLPDVQPFLYGIKPAIIAIILGAIFPLAKSSLKSWWLAILGMLVLAGSLLGYNEIFLMFAAGALGLLVATLKSKRPTNVNGVFLFPFLQIPAAFFHSGVNLKLFWIFLKIGAILYGSGYVLFAFLDAELVATGLLSRQELIDAIAVGQFTPGPVFSAVTFIGYQINGLSGAAASTIAIFLPSFVFVALLNPLVKKLRNSSLFSAFLDAVNVASVAVIIAVCATMAKETSTDWRSVCIGMLSLVVTFGFRKINSAVIVVGGSLLGYVLTYL